MGKQKEFRQLTKYNTDSVAAKTSLHGLIQLVKTHCEISWPEADLLGRMLYYHFVEHSDDRDDGEILFPAKWVPGKSGRNTPPLAQPIMVRLSVYHPHDVELWRELGVQAFQQARIVRLIEEAIAQGTILSLGDLSLITIATAKTVRETVKPLWEQGIRLPLMGMAKCHSTGMRHTLAERALQRFLAGEPVDAMRKDLHMSLSQWLDIKAEAQNQIALGQEGAFLSIWQQTPENERKNELVPSTFDSSSHTETQTTTEETVYAQLTSYFGMSKAGADLVLEKVRKWLRVRSELERGPGQTVYYAVADYEPAGKALQECDLIPVVLDYLTVDDQDGFDQDAPKQLVTKRVDRYVRQAYEQGGVLNQSDLAFLLGFSSDAITDIVKSQEKFLPTRGNVVDIGPGLTHAKKVIRLHMEGYSESEIKQRTNHSYASIENYIDTFCKVMGLSGDGLTPVEIRIALGCSLKLVKDYLALGSQFDQHEYRWTWAQVRNRYALKKKEFTKRRQE